MCRYVLFVCALTLSQAASAVPVRFDFTGDIQGVTGFMPGFSTDQTVSGHFILETDSTPSLSPDGAQAFYRNAILEFEFSIGGWYSGVMDPENITDGFPDDFFSNVRVGNEYSAMEYDYINWQMYKLDVPLLHPDYTGASFVIVYEELINDILSDRTLDFDSVDPDDWGLSAWGFGLYGPVFGFEGDVFGNITSMARSRVSVPEPATWLLFVTALLAVSLTLSALSARKVCRTD